MPNPTRSRDEGAQGVQGSGSGGRQEGGDGLATDVQVAVGDRG